MPAPTTIDEFLDLVRKSGVVDITRLGAYVDRLREAGHLPGEPNKFALQLIRDGLLTHFQAEQFLQGKWRRFTIGKYKVLERLGTGGMGSVYLCEHMIMRRRVAVKVLPPTKASDSSSLERFHREARAVAALDHPNIVRAYDVDKDENLHFLVMEHVDGASLQEIIKKTGPMDVLRAAHYMRQSALGLQHAHDAAALVHRDIKPGNILVDRYGIVKILDMGLARFFHDEQDELTKKYDENVLGTADYLAPEQALDSHGADIRADIYSLGGTFYFCLTGRPPFSEGSVAQKLIWHQTRQPKPIRNVRPEVPEGLAAILEKMMAKDKADRYQSPQELADALAPWTETPIPPPPEDEMPQFSLAARAPVVNEAGMSSSSRSPGDTVAPVPPRKPWQVVAPASPRPQPPRPAPAPVPPARNPAPKNPASRSPAPQPSRAPAPPSPAAPPLVASPAPAPRAAVAPSAPLPASTPNNGMVLVAPTPAISTEPTAENEFPEPISDFPHLRKLPSLREQLRIWTEGRPWTRWALLAAAILLPLACLLIGMLMSSGSRKGGGSKKGSAEPIRITPQQLGFLRPKPGDHFIVTGDVELANLAIDQPNVILESEPGKKITWKCPTGAPTDSKLLIINKGAGVQLRGFILDGNNHTESLVTIYGKAPGIRLENLKLQNSKKYGILLANCEGTQNDPLQFVDLAFTTEAPDQSAIRFDIKDHTPGVKVNRFLRLEGCRFQGPGKKMTAAHEGFVDTSTLTMPGDVRLEVFP